MELVHPIPWFSSLWTLQESILCPEMELCTRDWTTLEDNWSVPISLNTLITFIGQCKEFCPLERPVDHSFSDFHYRLILCEHICELETVDFANVMETWPRGPRELSIFHDCTEMSGLMETESPVAVFNRATVRECTGSRAPAIMSALGVTDWYKRALVSGENRNATAAEPLLFNSFPISFIREASLKFGASFFQSRDHLIGLGGTAEMAIEKREVLGSMIPFTKGISIIGQLDDLVNVDRLDHSSVQSWFVQDDGSVHIRHVGLVASSVGIGCHHDAAPAPRIRAYVDCAVGGEGDDSDSEDLVQTLQELAGDFGRVYAVSLWEDLGQLNGILLFGLGYEHVQDTDYLVRVGNFFLPQQYQDKERKKPCCLPSVLDIQVDWVVL